MTEVFEAGRYLVHIGLGVVVIVFFLCAIWKDSLK